MFNFFKRKPDPRIAELEWENKKLRAELGLEQSVVRGATEHIEELENALKSAGKTVQVLIKHLENHKAATLSWTYTEFSDGSGSWIYLEQDDDYSIDPRNDKFYAYFPVKHIRHKHKCKEFDDMFAAKQYLETLYLKNHD